MNKPTKYFVIVNPAANRDKAAGQIPALESVLNSQKINYELVITKAPLHAQKLAKEAAAKKVSVVIAAGGDGTVNEVINGLARSQTALGVIPIGSGNDFSKMLVLKPEDLQFAVDIILRHKIKKIDLGLINNRYFINVAAMGFIGRINQYTKKSPKFLKGFSMYLYSILKVLIDYYPHHFQITARNQNDKTLKFNNDFTLCSVGNGRYQGEGFRLNPESEIDDGLLDICLVDPVSRLYILRMLSKVIQGTHGKLSAVNMLKVKEITIKSDQVIPLHIDGEPVYDQSELKIKVVPQALNIIIP